MYLRWSERKGFKINCYHKFGDEAGHKSVAYKIKGLNAYGWLKVESGVHRLVEFHPLIAQREAYFILLSLGLSCNR